jgi:Glyoxalase/Bleomycin resistance protein/Dioxygenase superfamily
MIRHVAIEVPPGSVDAEVDFWSAVGFERVEVPAALGEDLVWMEREGTQIHLLPVTEPVVPPVGHPAVEVEDFEEAVDRLESAGFEVSRRSEYWGFARAKVRSPGGHVVELMAGPPTRSSW